MRAIYLLLLLLIFLPWACGPVDKEITTFPQTKVELSKPPDIVSPTPLVRLATTQATAIAMDHPEISFSPLLDTLQKAVSVSGMADWIQDWYVREVVNERKLIADFTAQINNWAKAYELLKKETGEAYVKAEIERTDKDRGITRWLGGTVSFLSVGAIFVCLYLMWISPNKIGAAIGAGMGMLGVCVGYAMILYSKELADYGLISIGIGAGGVTLIIGVSIWFAFRNTLKQKEDYAKTQQQAAETLGVIFENLKAAGKLAYDSTTLSIIQAAVNNSPVDNKILAAIFAKVTSLFIK